MKKNRIVRDMKHYVKDNILVILITLNSLLLVSSVMVQGSLVANEQITVGVMGYTSNGQYNSLSGDDIMDAGHQFKINDDRYSVVLETSRPRNITNAQLVGSKSYKYTRSDGTNMTYQYYQKLYQFEFVAYTQARGIELAPLIKQAEPTKQLFYKYDFSAHWEWIFNDYASILLTASDRQRGYFIIFRLDDER
jgi:hypothetical protein